MRVARARTEHRCTASKQRCNRINNSCTSRAGEWALSGRRRRRRRSGAAYVDAVVAHGAVRGARRPVEVARRAQLHAHRDAAHLDRAVHGRRAHLPALLHRVHRLRVALRCTQSAWHGCPHNNHQAAESTGKHTCSPALHSLQTSHRL